MRNELRREGARLITFLNENIDFLLALAASSYLFG